MEQEQVQSFLADVRLFDDDLEEFIDIHALPEKHLKNPVITLYRQKMTGANHLQHYACNHRFGLGVDGSGSRNDIARS